MSKNKTNYRKFLIEYGEFYERGERWYTWPDFPTDDFHPVDPERNGFESLKEAKAAIDGYWKASQ